ncbi:TetR/AcrR family transcriptional regulator [Micromonospora sp. NBC_01796]|uniref:TetR/AcrR family transcriptional regulator n=1 Tax=Micromonospora sp. NBC_01796 TaxID=2975987 RepID=UPI002DDC4369|nr:TetR family transcriptional regulator [Micromonospora sp. NBC_01796]WSA86782.1 TetR/AcrR family transcriptional regulator [Micromonospora sp. NBC_01796]
MTDSADKPRRLTRKGQATRERILQAATDLIAVHGVAGTGTEDVRRAAGVSGSQIYHYFDSKQALIRAVITRQADAAPVPGQPMMGLLDSFDALRAWADAAIERQEQNDGRGECTLGSLAGELSATDEESREDLSKGFLRWQSLLHDGLFAMQDRGELHPDADLDELSLALLTALQGGTLLSQTMRDTRPLRASMNAALAYIRSFAPPA